MGLVIHIRGQRAALESPVTDPPESTPVPGSFLPGTDRETESIPPSEARQAKQSAVLNTMDRLELWDREGVAPMGFVILLLLAGAAVLYVFAAFVHDIVLAFVIAGLFGSMYRRLLPRVGNRWVCSTLVTLAALILVAAPVIWLGLALFEELTNAYVRMKPGFTDGTTQHEIQALLARLGIRLSDAEIVTYVDSYTARVSDFALERASWLVNNLIAGLLHFCVIVALVFYTLVEGPKLKDFLFRLSPLPDEQDQLIVEKFTTVARSVLVGNGIGSALQGIVGGIAMALVGLPSPVFWGFIMTILAFLPLIGVSVVVLPAGFYLVFQGRTAEGVAFMTVCMSLHFVLENILKTKLMGAGVRVHEVPLFLSILGGLAVFGVLGILYGPLIVAMFMTLTDLYMTHYRLEFAARFIRRKRGRGSIF